MDTLKSGSKGISVLQLQLKLKRLAYKPSINGLFDDDTLTAVKEFQTNQCLPVTGEIADADMKELDNTVGDIDFSKPLFPLLKMGVNSPDAEELQRLLKMMGYLRDSVDGKIGENSVEAIRAFQRNNGLPEDGVVGENTWKIRRSGFANIF